MNKINNKLRKNNEHNYQKDNKITKRINKNEQNKNNVNKKISNHHVYTIIEKMSENNNHQIEQNNKRI